MPDIGPAVGLLQRASIACGGPGGHPGKTPNLDRGAPGLQRELHRGYLLRTSGWNNLHLGRPKPLKKRRLRGRRQKQQGHHPLHQQSQSHRGPSRRRRPSQSRRKHHHLGGAAQKSLKRRGAVHILVEPEKDPGRPEAQGEALLVHGGIWPALCGPAGRGLRTPGRTTGRSCHVERYVLGLPPIARLGRELGEPLLAHGR